MDDRQGEDEGENGEGADSDEGYIDGPVKPLPSPAVIARLKMPFVVGTHLQRDAGNIVAPARKNVANDLIGALCHRFLRFLCPSLHKIVALVRKPAGQIL